MFPKNNNFRFVCSRKTIAQVASLVAVDSIKQIVQTAGQLEVESDIGVSQVHSENGLNFVDAVHKRIFVDVYLRGRLFDLTAGIQINGQSLHQNVFLGRFELQQRLQ